MSTNLIHFRPILTAPCAAGNRRPSSVGGKGSPSKWWTPIFGWSSEPDYFDPEAKTEADDKDGGGAAGSKQRRSRFAPGCFTEEKARQLRIKTIEMETYHDAMYHSSIANRLASDFRSRSDL